VFLFLGPSFGAKCYLNGGREGRTVIYHADRYPWSTIGEVSFMWRSSSDVNVSSSRRTIWIWTHPSCHDAVFAELEKIFCLSEDDCQQTPVAGQELDVKDPEIMGDCLPPLKKKLKLERFDDATRVAKRQKLQETVSDLVVVQTDNFKQEHVGDVCVMNNKITSANPKKSVEMNNAMDVSMTCSSTIDVNSCSVNSKTGTDANVVLTSKENYQKNNKKSINRKKKNQKITHPPMISKLGLTRTVYDNGTVTLESLKDDLCRFRLIGPTAHRVVSEALSFVNAEIVAERFSSDETTETGSMNLQWWKEYYSNKEHYLQLLDQMNCWKTSLEQQTAADFPIHVVVSLLVKDPRLFLPTKRTPVSNNNIASGTSSNVLTHFFWLNILLKV